MKTLAELPLDALVRVSEECGFPAKRLEALVEETSKGVSAAFLARYRADLCDGLDERAVRAILARLRDYQDLGDRRISVLTSLRQSGALTDDLKKQIEGATSRRELNDIYRPHIGGPQGKDGPAIDKSLDPLARILWFQQDGLDLQAEVERHVNPENGTGDAEAALRGAYRIAARWLSEKPEILRQLRKLCARDSQIEVSAKGSTKLEPKVQALVGYRAKASEIDWKRRIAVRRSEREGRLQTSVELPQEATSRYLERCLIKDPDSPYAPHLKRVVEEALVNGLADRLKKDVLLEIDEQADHAAIESSRALLRQALLAAPARDLNIVGIDIDRRGHWRAVLIDAGGKLRDHAVVDAETRETGADSPAPEPEPDADKVSAAPTAEISPEPEPAGEESPTSASGAELEPIEDDTASSGDDSQSAGDEDGTGPPEKASEPESSADSTATGDSDSPQEPVEEDVAVSTAPVESQPAESGAATGTSESEPEPVESEKVSGVGESGPAAESVAQDESDGSDSGETSQAEAAPSDPAVSAEAGEPLDESQEQEASEPKAKESPTKGGSHRGRKQPARRVALSEFLLGNDVDLIVFEPGPHARATERFLRSQIRRSGKTGIAWKLVRHVAARSYGTSQVARKDLPKLDPVFRRAASLARLVSDPLDELVKMDPAVFGIGHHHGISPERLRDAFRETVECAVHDAGVDPNRASVQLLSFVPGLTARLAERVVKYRRKHGPFRSRQELRKVDGFSNAVYDQAVGFLRVEGDDPLDSTGARPQDSELHARIAEAAECDIPTLLAEPERLEAVDPEQIATPDCPAAVVRAAIGELSPERRQLRGSFEMPQPAVSLRKDEELQQGAKVSGVVASVADFGVFVDIGANKDGLLHISQIRRDRLEDSKPTFEVGESVEVFVKYPEQGDKGAGLTMLRPREGFGGNHRDSGRGAERFRPRERQRRAGGRSPRRSDRQQPFRQTFGPDAGREKAKREREAGMSRDEKLDTLHEKYRTKV